MDIHPLFGSAEKGKEKTLINISSCYRKSGRGSRNNDKGQKTDLTKLKNKENRNEKKTKEKQPGQSMYRFKQDSERNVDAIS